LSKWSYVRPTTIQLQKFPGNSKIGKKKHVTSTSNGRLPNSIARTGDRLCTEPSGYHPKDIAEIGTPVIKTDDALPLREDIIWTSMQPMQPKMAEDLSTPKPRRRS